MEYKQGAVAIQVGMRNIFKTIKENLRTNKIIYSLYYDVDYRDPFKCQYTFEDRKKDNDKVCIVLAGYKELLWPVVFDRLKTFAPSNMDVCIITSGMFNDKISRICKENDWSYLGINQNNVSLAQNVAIKIHPKAQYIYKLDEDIFVTDQYFEKMLDAYKYAHNSYYRPGVICPTIPVNGFTYIDILRNYNALEIYSKRFGKPVYDGSGNSPIHRNPEIARFLWGDDRFLPKIDVMNKEYGEKAIKVYACAVRFSIGAMLFERSFWKEMGYFKLGRGVGLGTDERQVSQYCAVESRPLMISGNTVVGHLGFGAQNDDMMVFYKEHPEVFEI